MITRQLIRKDPLAGVRYTATADENRDRAMYQSARTRGGRRAPLPLSLKQAWAEVERMGRPRGIRAL